MKSKHVFQAYILACNVLLSIFASMYVTNERHDKLLEITDEECHTLDFVSETDVEKVLEAHQWKVATLSNQYFDELSTNCTSRETNKFVLSFPGTKWCGPGNQASSYSDLGYKKCEDKCCRNHDFCPNFLYSHECIGDKCNLSQYTSSLCECDRQFQECLRKCHTPAADLIGAIYFNLVRLLCFEEVESCTKPNISSTLTTAPKPNCDIEFRQAPQYRVTTQKAYLLNKKIQFISWVLQSQRLHGYR